ncbi:MAG: carotenoid biosynthesis protein [Verrucomicrobia bacterium]|nr:carotenoid biosynthesis protein [Verrucomicrobiota bacterium]
MLFFRSPASPSQRPLKLVGKRPLLLPLGMIPFRLREALWKFFLLWAGVGLLAVTFRLNPTWAESLPLPTPLNVFISLCLRYGDFVSMILAASHVYFSAVDRLGLRPARVTAAVILISSAALETFGTLTGIPFGSYQYTDAFGPRMGGILPLAIPLAWFAVVAGANLSLSQYWRNSSRAPVAIATGAVALIFDFLMEPFAYAIRGYWHWADHIVPPQNYFSWFIFSALLAWITPVYAPPGRKADPRPAITLGIMTGLFIAARIAHGI